MQFSRFRKPKPNHDAPAPWAQSVPSFRSYYTDYALYRRRPGGRWSFSALALMTISHPLVGWPAKIAMFLATSLCSSALMRLLVRTCDSAFSIPVGVVALSTGIVMAWFAVRRWRRVAPLRCWASLGLCAGFGGAGLVMLLCHAVVYLTTPVGAMRSLWHETCAEPDRRSQRLEAPRVCREVAGSPVSSDRRGIITAPSVSACFCMAAAVSPRK